MSARQSFTSPRRYGDASTFANAFRHPSSPPHSRSRARSWFSRVPAHRVACGNPARAAIWFQASTACFVTSSVFTTSGSTGAAGGGGGAGAAPAGSVGGASANRLAAASRSNPSIATSNRGAASGNRRSVSTTRRTRSRCSRATRRPRDGCFMRRSGAPLRLPPSARPCYHGPPERSTPASARATAPSWRSTWCLLRCCRAGRPERRSR